MHLDTKKEDGYENPMQEHHSNTLLCNFKIYRKIIYGTSKLPNIRINNHDLQLK
jgi:hypothetical protein